MKTPMRHRSAAAMIYTHEAQERSYKTGFIPVWKERGYD